MSSGNMLKKKKGTDPTEPAMNNNTENIPEKGTAEVPENEAVEQTTEDSETPQESEDNGQDA